MANSPSGDSVTDRLVRVLESLDARIAEQGGQRKARPYIRSQLRRLRRQIS